MTSIFWRRAWAIFSLAVTVGVFFVKLGLFHQAPPPEPPAITTQRAYDQICGHPDACASMHDFIQQVQAERQDLEISPTPASADPAKIDQIPSAPTQPPSP